MEEVQYEIWPPRPRGGQVVGSGPSGVKATHYLGIEAVSTSERSQFKNKKIVEEMMQWALLNYV